MLALALTAGLALAADKTEPTLTVYLPRSVAVAAETIRLGDVAAMRCDDKALAAQAEAVPLGRAAWAGETITIDRRTILSRLAAEGIPTGRVQLTGAETVAVRRKERVVPADRLVAAAEAFLKQCSPVAPGCSWRLTRPPEDLRVSGDGPVELKAEMAESAPANHLAVVVKVVSGKGDLEREAPIALSGDWRRRTLERAELMFRITFPAVQAVATRAIAAGEMITPANARLETVQCDRRPDAAFSSPFGKLATVAIAAGTQVRPSLTRPAEQAKVVRRSQSVVMRIEGPGFVVTALGLALADGRPGDVIKVRNVDTLRVVTAKVSEDGSVEPVFEAPNATSRVSGPLQESK